MIGLLVHCLGLGFEIYDNYLIDIHTNLVLPLLRRHRVIIGRSYDLWGHQLPLVILSVLIDYCLISPYLVYLSVISTFQG